MTNPDTLTELRRWSVCTWFPLADGDDATTVWADSGSNEADFREWVGPLPEGVTVRIGGDGQRWMVAFASPVGLTAANARGALYRWIRAHLRQDLHYGLLRAHTHALPFGDAKVCEFCSEHQPWRSA
jgi:hypothetical protein